MTDDKSTSAALAANSELISRYIGRRFYKLTASDWSLVLKSLLREDAEYEALINHTKLPTWASAFQNLKLSQYGSDRDSTPFMDTLNKLKELPASARPAFAAGVDVLVRECLDLFAAGNPYAETVLDEVLGFENYFEGVVSGALAEEIVLNRKIRSSTRKLMLQNLANRSFAMAISDKCWDLIEEEVPQTPAFAGAVMEHLTETGRPDLAFKLPLTFKPDEDDVHAFFDIQNALQEILEKDLLDRDDLNSILPRYPTWALELLRDLWCTTLRRSIDEFDALAL